MFLLVAALTLFAVPVPAAAQPALQQVEAELANGAVVLTFTTTAAAVPNAVKLLESPFRLYFDVPGFQPGGQHSWDVGLGPVRQVRAALNQPRPAILRVVVELTERAAWRMEPGTTPREFRLVITSGEPAAPAAPCNRRTSLVRPGRRIDRGRRRRRGARAGASAGAGIAVERVPDGTGAGLVRPGRAGRLRDRAAAAGRRLGLGCRYGHPVWRAGAADGNAGRAQGTRHRIGVSALSGLQSCRLVVKLLRGSKNSIAMIDKIFRKQ